MAKQKAENKTIEETIESIQSRFGEGSLMRLDSDYHMNIDAISTGSIKIDEILGIGGFPKGRISEIYGGPATGKCLTEDNYILTSFGYKTIKEIFNENGLKTYCSNKIVPIKYPLINKDGVIEYTKNFTFNNRRPVKKITTRTGLNLTGTYNHPLLVLNNQGVIVWKLVKDIVPGDYLVTRKGDNIASDQELVNTDEAFLLGMFIADATFQKNKIIFTNDNPIIKTIFEKSVLKVKEFKNIEIKKYDNNKKGSINYHINSKEAINLFYKRHGISIGVAKDKMVPKSILSSNIKVQIQFLRGYFDCESYLRKDLIEVSSSSFNLMKQIQLMLKNIGIVATLKEKKVKQYPQNHYYKLMISGSNFALFIKKIGYLSKDISKIKLNKISNEEIPNIKQLVDSFYNSIDPIERNRSSFNIKRVKNNSYSISRLKEILKLNGNKYLKSFLSQYTNDNLFFDKVISNKNFGNKPTFDVEMESTHTFICESIINHNTTLALHVIEQAQKAGGIAAIVDTEHALDKNYVRRLGVDLHDLLIAQPNTAEEALQIIEQLVKDGNVSVVVLDSVAALLPRAESIGNIGETQIGLQARLMSSSLRKLVGLISRSQVCALFINQTRSVINAGPFSYGPNTTTSGGNALSFYASVRVEMKKLQAIKQGDEIIGIRTKIKTVKNKVAAPFKEVEVDIYYGEGISKQQEVLEIGISSGIIENRTSFYYYGDQLIGHGGKAAKEWLADNPEVCQKIREFSINKEQQE